MLGKHYIETLARIPADTDNASEFRYRDPVIDEHTLVVSVSQSGETVDVLEAMAVAKRLGALQVTICNTEGAQTTRVADGTVYIRCGPERGVASTKAFTASVAALYILALRLGAERGTMDPTSVSEAIRELARLPALVARQVKESVEGAKVVARHFAGTSHMLFLGRGLAFPVAMEGALKMKEISYIHAEGYAAGEMKHGPIALIDEDCPTVAVATENAMRSKIVSNIEQVHARGGDVVAVVSEGDTQVTELASATLTVCHAPARPTACRCGGRGGSPASPSTRAAS
jgi:glucosamine--fructose-6-phosphate aminotransferase (isomerizing)